MEDPAKHPHRLDHLCTRSHWVLQGDPLPKPNRCDQAGIGASIEDSDPLAVARGRASGEANRATDIT